MTEQPGNSPWSPQAGGTGDRGVDAPTTGIAAVGQGPAGVAPPTPDKSNRLKIVVAVNAVIVLVGAVVIAVLLMTGGDDATNVALVDEANPTTSVNRPKTDTGTDGGPDTTSPDDFARSHPGGSLGRRLLTHVRDVMRAGKLVPAVSPTTGITDSIVAMSRGGLGLVAVTTPENVVLGIFTDGDLRRAFEKRIDLQQGNIASVMHSSPRTIGPDRLAVEAVETMERLRINALLVVDADNHLIGALNMHDLFTAKVI